MAKVAPHFLNKGPLFFFLVPLLLFLDRWTKNEILDSFRVGQSRPQIPGFFDLTYVQNRGAAFGFFAGAPASFREPFFLLVPVIALTIMGVIFFRLRKSDTRVAGALSLVMSGALGNLWDRLQLGFVVDFLDFHWQELGHFPAFNVADSSICVGVGILILDSFLQGDSSAPGEEA